MTRRVTPTGVLVLPASATREQWLAERRNGIGASDVPKIVGLSQYGTAMHIWADKTGRVVDDETTEAGEWGQLIEDTIARRWAELNGVQVTRVGMLAHAGQPWRRASLDRRVHNCPDGPCAVQVKMRSAFKAGQWSDAVPDDVGAQVQWELLVSGFDHEHVAALIGGNRLEQHVVEADTAVQAFLADEAERVWAAVQADTPPDVDPDGSLVGLYDRMYPSREGAVELPPEAKGYLEDYRLAAALGRDAEVDKERAKAALLGYLGDAEVGLIGGAPAFTYRAQDRKPYTVAAKTIRTLRLVKDDS